MSQNLTPIDQFKSQILSQKAQEGLMSQLPSDVSIERFTSVVVRAVQEDPDLLQADRRSLMLAAQRAAQDGLIPDKRQGAFVVYNTKGADGQWRKAVQWQPMIQGLRKLLANHGFDLRAELVYSEDHFEYELGDNPKLTHIPAPLGTHRGDLIGAYAIATGEDGRKYREVMDVEELMAVKALSKSSGGPWAKFEAEMHRKTPAKRLFKYLPLPDDDERLHRMIRHDNEQFESEPESSPAAKEVQAEVRKAKPKSTGKLPKPVSRQAKPEEPSPEPAKKKTKTKKKEEAPTDDSGGEEEPAPPPAEAPKAIEGELVDDDEEGASEPLF